MWISFHECIGNFCRFTAIWKRFLFSSLLHCKKGVYIYITKYVSTIILSGFWSTAGCLLVAKFLGGKSYMQTLSCTGVSTLNACVQGSAVCLLWPFVWRQKGTAGWGRQKAWAELTSRKCINGQSTQDWQARSPGDPLELDQTRRRPSWPGRDLWLHWRLLCRLQLSWQPQKGPIKEISRSSKNLPGEIMTILPLLYMLAVLPNRSQQATRAGTLCLCGGGSAPPAKLHLQKTRICLCLAHVRFLSWV